MTMCSCCMFQVQRIPSYDKYLGELLAETEETHPDYEDLSKAANKVRAVSLYAILVISTLTGILAIPLIFCSFFYSYSFLTTGAK